MSSLTLAPSPWEAAKTSLKQFFSEEVFKMWFEPLHCVELGEDNITLGVPNDFAAIWIQENYLDLIVKHLGMACGRQLSVTLQKSAAPLLHGRSGNAIPAQSNERGTQSAGGRSGGSTADGLDASAGRFASTHAATHAAEQSRPRYSERLAEATLNPRNTFDTLVVGSNNQMAHAAAMAVAQAPAQAYNPLFLYGDTGLGKTHLMHAIGHAILQNRPDARVVYLSTERFTNEFIQALQENNLTKFRQRYRRANVLLLDDVQFLADKERIQEEFFHTFNDLFESGKQIVLSSDRRASEIQKLEARLVSRFEWGLPADIQAPDFETRVAILRSKAATLKAEVPHEVITFIAQHISGNVRRLEGALIKVSSYAALTGRPLDIASTEKLLQDVLIEQAQNLLTIETIQKRVADHFQIRHSDMTSKRRPNNIAIPRQIAMYLSRKLTKHSLQDIGDSFGGRDHGTVIHACKAVDNMIEQDPGMRGSIEFLRNQLAR
ncbi:chromosomal replication initiator DnaA [Cephaloticoccus primus]|uniref:Chromosomal replication initiator protein DnaA n=1 Tax=Cephaloticoccus primus TaxID=1548207 RepID=A0A139SLJ5_9BACT|nr:chromosomal replication initiator protein DnaA [Cephaloticoccus primus]KXU35429.1 chromosomal replication initiator DnaA [Cephaloticoccus primus]